MKSAASKPTHITRGNVMDDLGFSPETATALKFKAELYRAVLKYATKYSQRDLQAILGEPQPRVSELLNGKIANKSVDKLLQYAGRLGIEVKGKFAKAAGEIRAKMKDNAETLKSAESRGEHEKALRMRTNGGADHEANSAGASASGAVFWCELRGPGAACSARRGFEGRRWHDVEGDVFRCR